MIIKNIFYLIIIAFFVPSNESVEISQWRGPNRDGKYPDTNLLKQWPENGPDLIWSFEGLGEGHGNVGIGKNKLFVCGMPDTVGIIYSFDLNGDLLWKKEYGLEWYKNYTGSRSTPTVVGDLVYFESGQGVVFCYDGNSGDLIWSVDLLRKFNAENIQWGMAESLLVDGNTIYCTPGGPENNVVALNRFNGETIWTSIGNRQPSAYCSPILVEHNNTRLIVTMTAESIIGLDAGTGEFYWSIEQQQGNKIHANSPVYHKGKILCSSSSSKSKHGGTVQIQLSDDGKKADVRWRREKITNLMSGFILNDGFIFGSLYNKSDWYCLNWETGETEYSSKALYSGVIVYA
ncbi:MAG: PQQ-binding-like beta-propeller repeat protein, partial [Cyclobacteriaceae bacterium]|nr:PQQ-binding-like beta-propeller repeat protein [Cyclobacteriaceae bacterium]